MWKRFTCTYVNCTSSCGLKTRTGINRKWLSNGSGSKPEGFWIKLRHYNLGKIGLLKHIYSGVCLGALIKIAGLTSMPLGSVGAIKHIHLLNKLLSLHSAVKKLYFITKIVLTYSIVYSLKQRRPNRMNPPQRMRKIFLWGGTVCWNK